MAILLQLYKPSLQTIDRSLQFSATGEGLRTSCEKDLEVGLASVDLQTNAFKLGRARLDQSSDFLIQPSLGRLNGRLGQTDLKILVGEKAWSDLLNELEEEILAVLRPHDLPTLVHEARQIVREQCFREAEELQKDRVLFALRLSGNQLVPEFLPPIDVTIQGPPS